jgi:hypothetical protein
MTVVRITAELDLEDTLYEDEEGEADMAAIAQAVEADLSPDFMVLGVDVTYA